MVLLFKMNTTMLLILIAALLGQSCWAMDYDGFDPQPNSSESSSSEEQEAVDYVQLNFATMSHEEGRIWFYLDQHVGSPKNPRYIYELMKRLFEIHGYETPFRLGTLTSDLLTALINLKGVLQIEECFEQNIQDRYRIPLQRIGQNINLINYVQHYNNQFITLCQEHIRKTSERLIKNLGKKRRKYINDLRRIINSSEYDQLAWPQRLTNGLSKFMSKHDSGLSKQHLPGSPEHMDLFERRVQEVFDNVCIQLLHAIIPWIRVYRELVILKGLYLDTRRFLDKYTKKWFVNSMMCYELGHVRTRTHLNFRSLYEKYVADKMTNRNQLYPGGSSQMVAIDDP